MLKRQETFAKGVNAIPDAIEDLPENIDWRLKPIREPNNKYAVDFIPSKYITG